MLSPRIAVIYAYILQATCRLPSSVVMYTRLLFYKMRFNYCSRSPGINYYYHLLMCIIFANRKELNLLQKLYSLYNAVLETVNGYYDIPWTDIDIEAINNQLLDFQNK